MTVSRGGGGGRGRGLADVVVLSEKKLLPIPLTGSMF
jgi:hypothetical protein